MLVPAREALSAAYQEGASFVQALVHDERLADRALAARALTLGPAACGGGSKELHVHALDRGDEREVVAVKRAAGYDAWTGEAEYACEATGCRTLDGVHGRR